MPSDIHNPLGFVDNPNQDKTFRVKTRSGVVVTDATFAEIGGNTFFYTPVEDENIIVFNTDSSYSIEINGTKLKTGSKILLFGFTANVSEIGFGFSSGTSYVGTTNRLVCSDVGTLVELIATGNDTLICAFNSTNPA